MSELDTGEEGGEEKEAEELPLNQAEFRSTPYQVCSWEILGERMESQDFNPLEITVLPGMKVRPDMFEVFAEREFIDKDAAFHGSIPLHASQEEIDNKIDQIISELNARHEAEMAAAIAESYKTGVADGEAKVVDRYSKLSERLGGITQGFETNWAELFTNCEKKAFELSLKIAEKIIHSSIEIQPEYIIGVIKAGIESLGASKPLRIRVSPQDFEFLQIIGLPPELGEKELGATYVADDNIKGGCIIESNFGEIDLVIDRMWKEVHAKLVGEG